MSTFYQITSSKGLDANLYSSYEKAKAARLAFAMNSIRNFTQVWERYYVWWMNYHAEEYPDHPQPTRETLLDQFLGEDCDLIIVEVDPDESIEGNSEFFSDSFYQDQKRLHTL